MIEFVAQSRYLFFDLIDTSDTDFRSPLLHAPYIFQGARIPDLDDLHDLDRVYSQVRSPCHELDIPRRT